MKIIVSFCLLIFMSCQNTTIEKPNLEGLWCTSYNHCVYFKDTVCLFRRANFEPYKLQDDTLYVTERQKITPYTIHIQEDSLFIDGQQTGRRFIKQHKKHDIQIEQLAYSLLSDFDYLNAILYKNGILELDIKFPSEASFDEFFEPGFFRDTLDKNQLDYFNALFQAMPLDISKELKPNIISCVPEWSVMIQATDSSIYKLHYNYATLQKEHLHFRSALFFRLVQFSNLVKIPENDTLTKAFEAIEQFRKNEFNRNLKLHNDEYK